MDGRLYGALTDPLHRRQRFYPPGQHPAARAMREQLAFMERLKDTCDAAGVPCDTKAIEYIRERLAEFEQGESEQKAEYLVMLDSRA